MPKLDVTKKVMSMSLDLDLAERVREISDRSGRSMSYVIEKCVASYLPVMENGEDEDTKGPTKKTMYDMIQEMFAFFRAAGMKPEYYRIDNDSFRIIFDLTPGKKKTAIDEWVDDDYDLNAEDKKYERITRQNKQLARKEMKQRVQEYKKQRDQLLHEGHDENKNQEVANDAVNSDETQDKP